MKNAHATTVLDAYKVRGGFFVPSKAKIRGGAKLTIKIALSPRKSDPVMAAAGILKGKIGDGVIIQKRMRREWDR